MMRDQRYATRGELQTPTFPYARGGALRGVLAWIGSCITVSFGTLALTLPADSWLRVARSTADYALGTMIGGAPIIVVTVVLIRLFNLPRPWTEMGVGGGLIGAILLWAMMDDPRSWHSLAYPQTFVFYGLFIGFGAALGFFYWLLAGAPRRTHLPRHTKHQARLGPAE